MACDHYHRWPEDLALMRALGLTAYRFSVAWPRVLPGGRGQPNAAGLAFYDRLVDGLLEAGIAPWLTLYHWDLPQPLEDAGGWPARDTAEAFAAYTDALARRLGDRVQHWITLNEPWCSAFLGYLLGVHAPGRSDLRAALAAAHTLLRAHGLAVDALRAACPRARVGITLNLTPTSPASPAPPDVEAARRYDGYQNRWFLDPLYGRGYPTDLLAAYDALAPAVAPDDLALIARPTDFLGVNYYMPTVVRADPAAPFLGLAPVDRPAQEHTAMGWAVEPTGLAAILTRLHAECAPGALYVTENGAAYDDPPPHNGRVDDPARLRYLARHLAAAHQAIAAGVPLRGYFVWSLLDNFEWAEGYAKRFGLVHVDYATQARTLKASGAWYAAAIARGGLSAADPTAP